jgi:hypothetical protein
MKILSVGAELFHVDGRTDGHEEANSQSLLSVADHFITAGLVGLLASVTDGLITYAQEALVEGGEVPRKI